MRGEVRKRLRQAWRWLKKPHGLSPTSDFRRYVHLGSILACVWTAFISPLLLAVPIQVEQANGPRLWQNWAPLVIIISTLSDAVLATESLLIACTAFEVHTSQGAFSHHERNIVKCARRYARSWAALDLLTALPAALTLFLLLDVDWTQGVWVVQLILLLKGVSILRILDKLVRWTDAKRSTSTSSRRKLVLFLLCSVVVFHWAACIFWLIATRGPQDSPPTASLSTKDEASGGGMSTTTSVPIPDSPYAGATVTAEEAKQTPQSCMADRRALLEDATLPQQYLCALVWASHIVSLSGGREYAAWGQWERVVAICVAAQQMYQVYLLHTDASVREYSTNSGVFRTPFTAYLVIHLFSPHLPSSPCLHPRDSLPRLACESLTDPRARHSRSHSRGTQTVSSGLQFLKMRVGEEDSNVTADPNLKYPWLPEAGYKAKLIQYITDAGAHARRHQRGTSDLQEIRGYKTPRNVERCALGPRIRNQHYNEHWVGAAVGAEKAGATRGSVRVPLPVYESAVAEKKLKEIIDAAMEDGNIDEEEQKKIDDAKRELEKIGGSKVRYGWRSWGREDEVKGEKEWREEIGVGFSLEEGPQLSEGLRVRMFLELFGMTLATVSYLKKAIELASANVHLTRLAIPGLPADQMWGQHVIHYLIHKLHVQEFRKGDLVVFPGQLMVGVHFVVRGKMHVADAAMWPEAVNRRGRCSGVRFNLVTSSHAILPSEEDEQERLALRKEAEECEIKTREKVEKERQQQEETAKRNTTLVFADRRPPSLAPEVVMRLPEGFGGHQEGGWEAVAGAGSSWGERSVASFAHEYPEVLREVLRQVREHCRVQETEALRQRVQANKGDAQRLGLHAAPEGEALPKDAAEGVDGNEHGVEGTGGAGDGFGGQEMMMHKASLGDVEGVDVSGDWLEDGLDKLDRSPGTWGGAGEGQTFGRTHGSIELEEVEVVADHQLPFGHVYDALLSVGCRASAPERKLFLRDHYGPLCGVPDDDIAGGHGNIGLKVTVISACDLPQAPTQFLDTVDGYCEIEWEGQTVATHVVENSLAPEWNESKRLSFDSRGITYEELLDDVSRPNIGPMLVTLIDWNSLSHHEPIGHVTIQPRALHKVLKFGFQSTVAYTLENDDHVQIQGSQEFYRGQQINLKPTTVTIMLEPLFKEGDPRRKPVGAVAGELEANLLPAHGSAGAGHGVEEVGEEEHHGHVTEEDFEHMVSILPRDEEAMSNVSIHAHSHATVYSLPNSTVLRDMGERFPSQVARMAIFARRQQHARIRLQWQDFGSSVVWLRNREMKRLLLSISKVGMGFAMQKKKMDNVLANMRDARDKAALEARELSAACRPGVGGQVARVMPEISDRDMVVLHRYFDWWIDASDGVAALQEEMETRHARASYAPKLSRLQVQMLEVERLRSRAAMDASHDPVMQRIREQEEEAQILDIRSDDVATGL